MSTSSTETTVPAASTAAPMEDPSLIGLLRTTDHKRIGRMFMVTAMFFGLLGVVLDLVVRTELTDETDRVLLGVGSFGQMFALSHEALILLFGLPFFLGAAIYLIPLQVGAGNCVFPRGAAGAFWSWSLSSLILLGAYAGDGGPYGANGDSVDLYVVALGAVLVSLLWAAVIVATTAFTLRSPGLFLDSVPPFTWASMVTSVILVVSLPVMVANLLFSYVDLRYGEIYLEGAGGLWAQLDWLYRAPQIFLFAVPALGVVAEVLPSLAHRHIRHRRMLNAAIGSFALFGFGAWAQVNITQGEQLTDGASGLLLVLFLAGALATVLAVLGLAVGSGSTARPSALLSPSGLATLGVALLALVGTAVAFLGALLDWIESNGWLDISPDAPLRFTTWNYAVFAAFAYGTLILGAMAAVMWWTPKIWGREVRPLHGRMAALGTIVGVLTMIVGAALSGILTGQPDFTFADPDFTDVYSSLLQGSGAEIYSAVVLVGLLVVGFSVVVAGLGLFRGLAVRDRVGPNPWNAVSPEWELPSPPPPGVPAELPELNSGTPILDEEHEDLDTKALEVGV